MRSTSFRSCPKWLGNPLYKCIVMGILYPIPCMYGVFTYIWLILMVNVGKYISYMDGMGIIAIIDLQRGISSKRDGPTLEFLPKSWKSKTI